MPELTYYHTEADTAMFTIYNILRLQGYSSPVILDTEDTDNYVQAAHIAHRITGDLYIKRKQQFIYQCIYTVWSGNGIFNHTQLHVLSGCDHNSGFYGVSGKAIVDRIEKSSDGHKLLQGCRNSLPAGDDTINDITKFVTRYVYSDVKSDNLLDARAIKWRAQNKKNMSRLPPDMPTLRAHIERANYLASDYHPICLLLEHILSVLITWPTYKLIMRWNNIHRLWGMVGIFQMDCVYLWETLTHLKLIKNHTFF